MTIETFSTDRNSAVTAMASCSPVVRMKISDIIGRKAVIAIVEIHDADTALDLSSVLADEGIDALEITLRTPAALQAIELAAARAALPIGAGTIIRPFDADHAVACGAQFLVSPGYDPALIEHTDGLNVPLLPGVITPSETQTAFRCGFIEMKLFPAGRYGGIELLNTLAPLFPDVSFVPCGGVDVDCVYEYLQHPSVVAVGGSWFVPANLIRQRAWEEIAERVRVVRSLQMRLVN